ncbi:unnamed protein product [Diatraea saccharalis]|uniref:Uncharacterized protein n=1 Tax=Diatraea saccharalis TaxID=40085 RepID=A0A9N9QXU3_9NEOP|nr:unnamed protein product [Diatraea saccharalis]
MPKRMKVRTCEEELKHPQKKMRKLEQKICDKESSVSVEAQCSGSERVTFVRWSGVSPEGVAPVFVYAASGDEESLAGACLARCRELPDCAAVVVAYNKGNCHGIAPTRDSELRQDNDVSYFKKICLEQAEGCRERWWALESTAGYSLHADEARIRVLFNTTVRECYAAVLTDDTGQTYRSAQWVGPEALFNAELVKMTETDVGNCILSSEDKFTEPESYRVSNYYTFYIENQCRHDCKCCLYFYYKSSDPANIVPPNSRFYKFSNIPSLF